MSGRIRPSARKKTLHNVMRSNLSITDKGCIDEVFAKFEQQKAEIEVLKERDETAEKIIVIKKPYKEKMKEVFVDCHFDYCGVFPENTKRKVKVHLCDDCFRGLHLIAEKKRSDNNARQVD